MTNEERQMFSRRLRERDAEIEQLREQVATLQASSGYEASIAQVECERLRAALQEIAGVAENNTVLVPEKVAEIARRALEPKP